MDHASGIVAVDYSPMLGVENFEFLDKPGQPLLLKPLLHPLACGVVDGGNVVDAVAHGVDIHH